MSRISFQTIWLIGIALIALPAITLILFVVLSLLGAPNNASSFLIACVGVLGILFAAIKQKTSSVKQALIVSGAYAVFIVGMLASSTLIYDNSWDGQTYHQETISRIKDGWNPIRTLHDPMAQVIPPWFNAKGFEFVASAIFCTTNRIESAKAVHLFTAAASLLITWTFFHFLLKDKTRTPNDAFWFALIAALNPVTLLQIPTFYVDGDLGAVYLCLLSSIGLLLIAESNSKEWKLKAWAGIACSLTLLFNLKLTGVILAACTFVASIGFSLYLWRNPMRSLRLAVASGFVGLVALLVVGVNPYLHNVGHFLKHPRSSFIESAGSVKEIEGFAPPHFVEQFPNRLARLFASLYGETNNSEALSDTDVFKDMYPSEIQSQHPNLHFFSFSAHPVKLEAPFCIEPDELQQFQACDVRIGGFGPWFGEILVLSLLLTLLNLKVLGKFKGDTSVALTFLCVLIVLLCTISIQHSWWARFTPQLWLLPVFLLLGYRLTSSNEKLAPVLTNMVLAITLCNVALILVPNYGSNIFNSITFREQLSAAKEACNTSHQIVKVYVPSFVSKRPAIAVRLGEAEIPFQFTEQRPSASARCYRVTDLPIAVYISSERN